MYNTGGGREGNRDCLRNLPFLEKFDTQPTAVGVTRSATVNVFGLKVVVGYNSIISGAKKYESCIHLREINNERFGGR